MKQHWIIFTPLWFYQKSSIDLSKWQPREFHRKNKVCNTKCTKLHCLIGQICKTVFCKLTQKISLSVSGKQKSRQGCTWLLVFLSQIFRYFPPFLGCYFSGTSCTFHFGQMFNGFLTSTFDFYWSLDLQFWRTMVKLSEGQFLFAVAGDYFE